MSKNYWDECIESSFNEHGIKATREQIENVAGDVEIAHENFGMAMGYHAIPNPLHAELEEAKRKLKIEQSKVVCSECRGSGIEISEMVGGRVAVSRCFKCNGDGKVVP